MLPSRKAFLIVAIAATGVAGQVTLSGTAAGASTLSGAPTVVVQPSGTVAGTTTLSGAPVAQVLISGTVAGVTTLSGAPEVRAPFSGTAAGTTALSGAPTVVVQLSGTVAGATILTGSYGTPVVQINVTGTVAGATVLSGSPTAQTAAIALSGTVAGSTNLSGGLQSGAPTIQINVTGASAGATTLSGAPTVQILLAGAVNGATTLAGAPVCVVALQPKNLLDLANGTGGFTNGSRLTVAALGDTDPFGGTAAIRLTNTTNPYNGYWGVAIIDVGDVPVPGKVYRRSMYLKANGSVAGTLGGLGGQQDFININYSTGSITGSGTDVISSSVLDAGNGWWLFEMRFTVPASVTWAYGYVNGGLNDAAQGYLPVVTTDAGLVRGITALSGAPTVSVLLSGTAAGTTTLSGTPTVQGFVALTGTAAGVTTLSGAPTIRVALTGTAAGVTTLSGSPTVQGFVALTGTSAGATTLAGAPTVRVFLSGAAAGATTLSGAPAAQVPLAGSPAGVTTLSGAPTVQLPLAGTVAGVGTLAGTPTVTVNLSGLVAGATTLAGDFAIQTTSVYLSGTVAGSTTLSGSPYIPGGGPDIAVWFYITERAMKSIQAPTGSPPVSPTDGIDLLSIHAFTVTAEADVGQTFTTGGHFDLFLFDENVGGWSLVPGLEQPVPAVANGQRRYTMIFQVQNSRGRVAFVTNGIGVTGGNVTVYYSPTVQWFPPKSV